MLHKRHHMTRRAISAGPYFPANKASFDRASETIAVASDDGSVKCFSAVDGTLLAELKGHEDAVQAGYFFQQALIRRGISSSSPPPRVWTRGLLITRTRPTLWFPSSSSGHPLYEHSHSR